MGRRTGQWRRRRSCQISAKEGVCHEHFCYGIWRRQENVSSAMVTGLLGLLGLPVPLPPRCRLYVVQVGKFGSCSFPLPCPQPRGPWQTWKMRADFWGKKKKLGFCSDTELAYRCTCKKTQKDFYIFITACIQRYKKPAWLVQAEGLWMMEEGEALLEHHPTSGLTLFLS